MERLILTLVCYFLVQENRNFMSDKIKDLNLFSVLIFLALGKGQFIKDCNIVLRFHL